MAINALTYANRIIIKDINNAYYESEIQYNHDSNRYVNITDARPLSLEPTGENYSTKTLVVYADGKKVRLHYKLYFDSGANFYRFYGYFDLVDKNDNLVQLTGLNYSHNNPTTEVYLSEYYDPLLPDQYKTIPFSDCYYVTSVIDYHQSGRETIVNDPALSLYPFGKLYHKVPTMPVGGYAEFFGTKLYTELTQSYNTISISTAIISNDAGFNEYYNEVDPDDEWHETGEKEPEPDPSGPGGGDRPSEDGGESVDFPGLPTTSVINTGLITLYNPNDTQLRGLAGVLWGNDFEQSIKKVLNDPFDGMIGLSLLPFSPTTSGSVSCEIGNFDTEVSMPLVNAQYYTLDCGSITVSENWKNALDYNATSIEIFVPFVGFRSLNIQDCMNKTLSLKYNIDILSGSGVAILKCGDKCLYEWPCNVAYNIPLTGSNKSALYTGLISIALSGAGGLATGGAMGAVGGAATSAINVATHAQSDVQRSGAIVSNTGVLGEFTPYIVIHRPKQSLAQNFKTYKGYQSNITSILGNCSGYTEVEYIHLTGIGGATDTELEEIESLLKEGVII